EATVVGDFQDDDSDTQRNLGGFFLQEESADHDDDDESSEGIFVENSSFDVGLWDRVRVVGTVAEVNGETRIVDVTEVTTLEENDELDSDFTPGTLSLDSVSSLRVNAAGNNEPDLEALEGMLVNIPADLALALKDQSNLKLLNEVTLTVGERPVAFTEQNSPDAEAYSAYLDSVYLKQIFYDDGENEGYAEIGRLAGFAGYSDASAPRLGDVTTTSSIAVLDYKISGAATFDPAWRLRAPDSGSGNSIAYTTTELGTSPNPRPAGPGSVGGDITLMTMNLNHWFKTLNGNGNTTALGLEPLGAPVLDETTFAVAQDEAYNRQLTKLTLAIKESNADLMVLTGVENDFDNTADASTAIEVLVEEVNAELGEERYSYLYPGQQFVGSGADTVAIVYDSSVVGIANGSSIAILDDAVLATLADFALHDFENDPVFGGADNNRAALAATFSNLANNDLFTVVATQWMGRSDSSVSAATGTNIDQGDGAEYWNARREQAAEALISWIETNPTGIDEADITLMGSLNAYASEQPVTALLDYGFERASSDYNSVRSGFTGSLDYLLFNEAFAQKRISSDVWHINADEAPALGYQIDSPYETSYFDETTATRFAENDPILAGMVMAIPPQAN
ncbi:MAG: ExeM/NucH family extracellular endonuclease, partial [Oceanobacter sp.]